MSPHFKPRAFLAIALFTGLASVAYSETPAPAVPSPAVEFATGSGAFSGKWTYRSYINDPDASAEPNNLLFGQAVIELTESADGSVSGSIGGTGWSLALKGTATYASDGAMLEMQGSGTVGGTPWIYDYFGYLSPKWSIGVNQRPSILGTVVRTISHGQAPAGTVASFLAVKQ